MLIAVNVLPLCWEEALSISLVEGAGCNFRKFGTGVFKHAAGFL